MTELPGRLANVRMDGELPAREDVGTVFDLSLIHI